VNLLRCGRNRGRIRYCSGRHRRNLTFYLIGRRQRADDSASYTLLMRIPFLLAASTFLAISLHAQLPAITTDPAADKANPPSMDAFQIPSHDGKLNALFYSAAGAGPHHTVVLLHGFPGNEKNLDLAQAIRRAGWNVLYFDYRGSWGAPGSFSFSNAMEDTRTSLINILCCILVQSGEALCGSASGDDRTLGVGRRTVDGGGTGAAAGAARGQPWASVA